MASGREQAAARAVADAGAGKVGRASRCGRRQEGAASWRGQARRAKPPPPAVKKGWRAASGYFIWDEDFFFYCEVGLSSPFILDAMVMIFLDDVALSVGHRPSGLCHMEKSPMAAIHGDLKFLVPFMTCITKQHCQPREGKKKR